MTNTSGVGRMWHNVLKHLSTQMQIEYWVDPRGGPLRPRPDVWLTEGHYGALGVPEPAVVHLQEASWRHDSTRPLLQPWFVDQFERRSREAVEAAAAVITPSESSRRQILEEYGFPAGHVHTVPLGVDLALFRPGRPGAENIIEMAGGDKSAPYVLFVSSLSPRKNLGALKTAMNVLARRGLPHILVIVGSPAPDRRDWKEMAAQAAADLPDVAGRVVFLGSLSDVELAAVTAGAAVFCLPSLMEGFGLTALEAMACGVPVVVSNRGSLPEVVGEAGVVTEPSADALVVALHDLITSPKRMEELSRAGLTRALEFSWRATANGWQKAIEHTVPVPARRSLEWIPPPDLGPKLLRHGLRPPAISRRTMRPKPRDT